MITVKTYKYKLYGNRRNKVLHRRINVAGIIYNHCIALHKRYYKLYGKSLNVYQLQKHIAKIKKQPSHVFWNLVGSQAIQDIIERIDKGYKLFFQNIKLGIKASPPSFKKVKKYKSFTLKQAGWKLLDGNKVKIQGYTYKYHDSRPIDGQIKTVTIKRDSLGDLYIHFVVKIETEVPSRSSNVAIGFDFGLKTFLIASDGTEYIAPLYMKQSLIDLAKANKILSRKKKFSKGWYKAKKALARVYQTVVNKRRDWFFKLAHLLTDKYDLLYFEDLNMKGMSKLWGRKISDLSFKTFLDILTYVAQSKNKLVENIDRFYPSSKTCNCCGYINKKLTLADRSWACVNCGVIHDRDLNASINICSEGIRDLSLGNVRLAVPSLAISA